jgi:ABC-type nickel/cobalt efflux system permease component RcnA
MIALVISVIMLLFSQESARRGHDAGDNTLYVAAAILYCGCAVWSCWYNWRRTNSALLAISLTILQTLSAAFVVGVFNLWLDRHNTNRYEREHGLG